VTHPTSAPPTVIGVVVQLTERSHVRGDYSAIPGMPSACLQLNATDESGVSITFTSAAAVELVAAELLAIHEQLREHERRDQEAKAWAERETRPDGRPRLRSVSPDDAASPFAAVGR
jgi:hypothetical protein